MKSLPLILAVLVVIIFALTITAMLLYKPLRLRWYESKLDSDDIDTRRHAVEKLLTLGDGGKAALIPWLEKQLDSDDINNRHYAVEKLLAAGPDGTAVIRSRICGKARIYVINLLGEPFGVLPAALENNSPKHMFHVDYSIGFTLFYKKFRVRMDTSRIITGIEPKQLTGSMREFFEEVKSYPNQPGW
ncbi:MAG: hypothetical protein ACYS8W_07600 [Planctomycetota bacterium]|jgi:hypothetical protein